MENDKSMFYIVAIVAIVAVVALVMMVMNRPAVVTSVPQGIVAQNGVLDAATGTSTDPAGEAYGKPVTLGYAAAYVRCLYMTKNGNTYGNYSNNTYVTAKRLVLVNCATAADLDFGAQEYCYNQAPYNVVRTIYLGSTPVSYGCVAQTILV